MQRSCIGTGPRIQDKTCRTGIDCIYIPRRAMQSSQMDMVGWTGVEIYDFRDEGSRLLIGSRPTCLEAFSRKVSWAGLGGRSEVSFRNGNGSAVSRPAPRMCRGSAAGPVDGAGTFKQNSSRALTSIGLCAWWTSDSDKLHMHESSCISTQTKQQ